MAARGIETAADPVHFKGLPSHARAVPPLRFRVFALLLAFLALAGCGRAIDNEELRICRQSLPAVAARDAAITLLKVQSVADPWTMQLDYREESAGVVRHRSVLCGFEADETGKRQLTRFATDEAVYTPMQVHILRRFWLDRPQIATLVDPGPGLSVRPALEVSRDLAYFLQALANALPSTAITMLVAVAYALIYGLVGRINLAFGEFAALGGIGAVAGSLFAGRLGFDNVAAGLIFSSLGGIALALLYGRLVERIVFAPLAFMRGQSILIATVAVSITLQEAMRLGQGPQDRWIEPVLTTSYAVAGAGSFIVTVTQMQILVAVVATLLAIAIVMLMRWSAFGRDWRATADDAGMAQLMGVSTRSILTRSFAIASGLVGMAGVIMTAYYGGSGFASGTLIGLKGLVAAVVGGIGSVGGALVGGMVIGLFEAFWSAFLPNDQRDLAVLSLLIVTFVFRPGGLFGYAESGPRQV